VFKVISGLQVQLEFKEFKGKLAQLAPKVFKVTQDLQAQLEFRESKEK
jgi:hypothetical protein